MVVSDSGAVLLPIYSWDERVAIWVDAVATATAGCEVAIPDPMPLGESGHDASGDAF